MLHNNVWYVTQHCLVCYTTRFGMLHNTVWYVTQHCLICYITLFDMLHDTVWYVTRHCLICYTTLSHHFKPFYYQVSHYRFSISWTRILPDGIGAINRKGIDYYNSLIDTLLSANIIPMVTLYHWDLPQTIEEFGGWTNKSTADLFEHYADICYREFGDRVNIYFIPYFSYYWWKCVLLF